MAQGTPWPEGQALETASEREVAAKQAGDGYIDTVQDIISGVGGTDVGFATMTKANVQLTEADATFAVQKGGPMKASNSNKSAADKVEQKGDR
jgi:hypothetical protein